MGQVRAAPLPDTLAVVYLGAGPAALAYATWAVVLSRLPASRASSLLFAVPVVAFLVGWVWLGEAPTLIDIAGGVLAMGGVALVNTLGRAPGHKKTPGRRPGVAVLSFALPDLENHPAARQVPHQDDRGDARDGEEPDVQRAAFFAAGKADDDRDDERRDEADEGEDARDEDSRCRSTRSRRRS